jgi:hypothetical protein
MPQWIDAKEKMPVKYGLYFVKIGGNKELLRLHEIESKVNKDYDVLWLDESDLANQLAKQLSTVKSIEEMVKLRYHHPNADLIPKQTVKKNAAVAMVGTIKEGKSLTKEGYLKYLENLFGVKRASKIVKMSKKLK